MLPNPALDAAAKWVPGVVSLALFIVFFMLWVKSVLDRIKRLEEKNAAQDEAFQQLLLDLGSYVKVEDNARTVNGIWKILRKVERGVFGMRIQLNLPSLPREPEEDDDER